MQQGSPGKGTRGLETHSQTLPHVRHEQSVGSAQRSWGPPWALRGPGGPRPAPALEAGVSHSPTGADRGGFFLLRPGAHPMVQK